jgi:hypothetical protein
MLTHLPPPPLLLLLLLLPCLSIRAPLHLQLTPTS